MNGLVKRGKFTAAQAAEKTRDDRLTGLDGFTAAQAAEKFTTQKKGPPLFS